VKEAVLVALGFFFYKLLRFYLNGTFPFALTERIRQDP
jgi:hypothetical protein